MGNWQCLGSGTFRELLAFHYISTGTRLLAGFLPVSWTWIKKVETYPDCALILGWNCAKKVGNWQCLGTGTFRELSAFHYISTRTRLLPVFLPVSWTWIKKVETYPGLAFILGWNGAKKVGNWQCLGIGTFWELSALHYISTRTRLLPGFLQFLEHG